MDHKRQKKPYILDKGTTQQEGVTIINIYASNNVAPNFRKHTIVDIKYQISISVSIVGEYQCLSITNR